MFRPLIAPRHALVCLTLITAPAWGGVTVSVDGLGDELKDNVLQRIGIQAQSERADLDQNLVDVLHEDAPDDIRSALQPFGYYNPTIDASLSGNGPEWDAKYRVDAGPQTTIDTVELQIEGEGKAELEDERERILRRLRTGEPLSHSRYDSAKSRLSNAAYAAGYLDARYKRAELRILADENLAQITLVFETGTRYEFGAVSFEQDSIDEDVLRRYVKIQTGAVYDPQVVLDTQFALSDLGYFSNLEIIPQRQATVDQQVPIVIRATALPRTVYNLGLGYGTDTGARVGAGVQIRRANRAGHTAKIETRLSEVEQTAGASYTVPLGTRIGESVGLSTTYSDKQEGDGTSRKWGVEVSLSRLPGDWQRRLYLAFAHEESLLDDGRLISNLLTPGVSFNRTELDDPIYARKGWAVFQDVHGAVREVLSSASFLQTKTILRGVVPLARRTRLLGRVEYGASIVEDFGELPASQRFFAGGDQSVRGYGYQDLGTRNEEGKVIGGKYLATGSVELETRVWREWGAAVFVDSGGADEVSLPQLYTGVGAGLRYRAPVGSVQLDLAHPLNDPGGGSGSGVRLHIGVRVGL
ncbi:MAG: autotransporter assembly complex protein TamA [Pseudomonadota bacterium]|nr:autotransporter assembly complex protein TamA [Pseudomonadota bacterium]